MGALDAGSVKAALVARLVTVQGAIDAAQGQHAVSEVAAGIVLSLTATGTVDTEKLPTVDGGTYTITVKTTSDATKYALDGKIKATGTSNVVYTITHTATGKTADTGIVVVTVTIS